VKKYFLVQPRCSGKTQLAIYEYYKDPDNTIFVVHGERSVSDIYRKTRGNIKNIISNFRLEHTLRGTNTKNLILDEYLSFKNKDDIYREVPHTRIENIYIFSSPDITYDKALFEFVKNNKRSLSYEELLKKYGDHLTIYIEKQIYELYYNFLTDEDTILINGESIIGPIINKYPTLKI